MIYYLDVDINFILRQPASALRTMFKIEPHEILALATILKAKGFDAVPTCDHHDDKGHCLGHEQATSAI